MKPDLAPFNTPWILQQRQGVQRNALLADPYRPQAILVEPEITHLGQVEDVATVFITNRECPFRCLMCDLWKGTTPETVPQGAVTEQILWALQQLPSAPHLKLYNAGNFFDEKAISGSDRQRLIPVVADHRTLIVECHPRMIDNRCREFASSIRPSLQVAMGLETVDPDVWPRLNKSMTLDDFSKATQRLVDWGITVRAFILLRTPFQDEPGGVHWAKRSIDFAFSIGVECCAVVPTRVGNGAMERLMERGYFHPPSLPSMETVMEYGLALKGGRVLVDLWDIEAFYTCPLCSAKRAKRLSVMNLSQRIPEPVSCSCRENP